MRQRRNHTGILAASIVLLFGALVLTSVVPAAAARAQAPVVNRPPSTSIDRDTILRRAKLWIDAQVPYSQGNFATDESPVMVGDYHQMYETGFQTDCSGYVAMAWGIFGDNNLPDHPNTKSLLFYATPITPDQLQRGDAIINPTGGSLDLPVGEDANPLWKYAHVVLFVGWVPNAFHGYRNGHYQGYYYAYEEGGYPVSGPTSYPESDAQGNPVLDAKGHPKIDTPTDEVIPDYSANKDNGQGGARYLILPYPYWPQPTKPEEQQLYFPVRFYGLSAPPVVAAPPTPTFTPTPTPTPFGGGAGGSSGCETTTGLLVGISLALAAWRLRRLSA